MSFNEIVQEIADARVDAKSLSDFVFKPAGFKVKRRLAPTIETLEFYIDYLRGLQAVYEQESGVVNVNGVEVKSVTQAISDALDAAGVENGLNAQAVVDNGRTQKEINKKTAFEYDTVAIMLADTTLETGKVVSTNGYYSKQDAGGAKYTISLTSTDYSIPLANNLHAVFADTFDIRKFGIVDNATLDQTVNIERMVAYADTREYEIDFHNYSIMTPETEVPITTGAYRFIKGMAFKKIHKIKNLKIANDKTKQLRYNTIPIMFTPVENGSGIFELENVTFDPYVANVLYHPTSGDGDGNFHGFSALWHGTSSLPYPTNQQVQTDYEFVYKNIHFESAACSYNLAVSFRAKTIIADNLTGDYIGLYVLHWTQSLYASNTHGVFRDDLYALLNRVLVTNLYHEEQEVGEEPFSYTQEFQEFSNISCVKKTTGLHHTAIKRQVMGTPTLKRFIADDVRGNIEWFAGEGDSPIVTHQHIQYAEISRQTIGMTRLSCGVKTLIIRDGILADSINTYKRYTFSDVLFLRLKLNNASPFFGGQIIKLTADTCELNTAYGLAAPYGSFQATYTDIEVINCTVNERLLFKGILKGSLKVRGGEVNKNYFAKLIEITNGNTGTVATSVSVEHMSFSVVGGDGNLLIASADTKPINAKVLYNSFRITPLFNVGTGGTLEYDFNSPSSKKKTVTASFSGAGTEFMIPHGISDFRSITSVSVLAYVLDNRLQPPKGGYGGADYSYFVSPTSIHIIMGSNSSRLGNAEFNVELTYKG